MSTAFLLVLAIISIFIGLLFASYLISDLETNRTINKFTDITPLEDLENKNSKAVVEKQSREALPEISNEEKQI